MAIASSALIFQGQDLGAGVCVRIVCYVSLEYF